MQNICGRRMNWLEKYAYIKKKKSKYKLLITLSYLLPACQEYLKSNSLQTCFLKKEEKSKYF